MKFLSAFAVFLALCQLGAAFLHTHIPEGCSVTDCHSKSEGSHCPQGTQHYRRKRCGTLWMKRKDICCPLGTLPPPPPPGGDGEEEGDYE